MKMLLFTKHCQFCLLKALFVLASDSFLCNRQLIISDQLVNSHHPALTTFSLPVSQATPVYPVTQSQVKCPPMLLQDPPFWHGSLAHSSKSATSTMVTLHLNNDCTLIHGESIGSQMYIMGSLITWMHGVLFKYKMALRRNVVK